MKRLLLCMALWLGSTSLVGQSMPAHVLPESAATKEEGTVSLVFAGDTTLDDEVGDLIAQGGDPLADFAGLFAAADVRLANLECVVATVGAAGRKNYTFRAHPRVLPVLRKHLDGPKKP